jgi:ABC-type transport system involved in cytochrome c biogenesis permease subunit
MYAALIVLALVAGAFGLRRGTAAFSSILFAAVTLTVWILRWIETGHLPLFGTYENALSIALATSLAGVVWRAASGATSLIAALVLAQGVTYDPMPYALTISERSLVVDVHAVLAWLAFGVFAAAAGLAVRVGLVRGGDVHGALLERALTIGFVLHTAMIASGSLYKFMLFGKVWSWDPIETMALMAWLAYGTLLHMSLLAGWGARRLARWSIATFVVLVLSYRAIIYFPSFTTYHIFDIGLKLHL